MQKSKKNILKKYIKNSFMTIQEIYNLAIQKGIESDFRPKAQIEKDLERKREKFAKASEDEKKGFDQESLLNPYSDTRVLHIASTKEIKKTLIGIDIDVAEILLAKELGDIDLVSCILREFDTLFLGPRE